MRPDLQLDVDVGHAAHPDDPIAAAVAAIEHDLCDRRGLKWEWAKIDDDIKEMIRADWREIISAAIATEPR